jgi:hypothetical protein
VRLGEARLGLWRTTVGARTLAARARNCLDVLNAVRVDLMLRDLRNMRILNGRDLRSGRVLAVHRAQGILVVENAVGHAGLDDGLRARAVSVAAPATYRSVSLAESFSISPLALQAIGGER